MYALQKPKEMKVLKAAGGRRRVDVEAAYRDMMRKLPKTFEYLAK